MLMFLHKGLVRTVNDGEDDGIIEKVRALVNRYLKQSRTVILAVVPANIDIHNNGMRSTSNFRNPHGRKEGR
jgi:hypothetical protein